jgi:hypothetical protein
MLSSRAVSLPQTTADALAQMAAGPADAAALTAEVDRVDQAEAARPALAEAHASLVATYPEASRVVVPR